MLNKPELRQHYRALRRTLSPLYRSEAAKHAALQFVSQSFFNTAKHIACYLPFREEMDTLPLIEKIMATKKCYLPRINKINKTLLFAAYKSDDALQLNDYGILEPLDTAKIILPQQLDIVILPLLAVDKKGCRLGSGAGYYDKTFAFLAHQHQRKPLLIGYAYAIQLADSLPTEPWDVPLDGVVTEESCRDYSIF